MWGKIYLIFYTAIVKLYIHFHPAHGRVLSNLHSGFQTRIRTALRRLITLTNKLCQAQLKFTTHFLATEHCGSLKAMQVPYTHRPDMSCSPVSYSKSQVFFTPVFDCILYMVSIW
jgi:hypothetical protein